MLRDYSSKWILAGVAFLILFAGACFWWYQHEIAPYKQEVAKTAKLRQQWETPVTTNTHRETELVSDRTAVDSTPQTAKKQLTETTREVIETENTKYNATIQVKPQMEQNDVRVSLFGFGPYPKVPEDYPSKVAWNRHYPDATDEVRRELELISRVLVKLWTDGDKDFRGGSTYKGKIYPHYNDTVYVQYKYRMIDGRRVKYVTRTKSGPQVSYNISDLDNPPPHLRILDLDSSGIDPYQFLDLP